MTGQRDPIERRLESATDLYDVTDWERRTWLDALAVAVYVGLWRAGHWLLVATAVVLFVLQLALSGYAVLVRPTLGVLTLLSVVPALLLAGYIWYGDPTSREPLGTVAITFLLGVLFASLAAAANTVLQLPFRYVPLVGTALFFFLVVGPVEETVKWLAIRIHAYRKPEFDAVIDGAVYGAVAGLGFAAIENALYISREVLRAMQVANVVPLEAGIATAISRTFAGPGHVIYSAFAGYYLGLAKFNPDDAGPIAVKGLLIAAFIHATYNTLASYLPVAIGSTRLELGLVGFILVFDGVVLYLLYRKLRRYRSRYRQAVRARGSEAG